MPKTLQALMARLLGEKNASLFLKRASGAFVLKTLNNGLIFITALLLARGLGPAAYGAYSFAAASLQMLMIFVIFGSVTLVVREIAQGTATQRSGHMRGVMIFATTLVIIMSGVAYLIVKGFLESRFSTLDPVLSYALLVTMLAAPFMALMRIYTSSLRGINQISWGLSGENLVRPLIFLIGIAYGMLIASDGLTLPLVLYANIASFVVAAFFLIGAWIYFRPSWMQAEKPDFQVKIWLLSGASLLFVSTFRELAMRVDRVMLGALSDASTVGLYTVASRVTELAVQFEFAIHMALAPMIAAAYARADLQTVKTLVTLISRIGFVLTVLVVAGMILFSAPLLGLFGEPYKEGSLILILLSLAKVLRMFIGPSLMILTMTGHEKFAAVGVGVAAFSNVGLNWLLIPLYGGEGAAIATVSSSVLWYGILGFYCWQRIGLDPSVLGLHKAQLAEPPNTIPRGGGEPE